MLMAQLAGTRHARCQCNHHRQPTHWPDEDPSLGQMWTRLRVDVDPSVAPNPDGELWFRRGTCHFFFGSAPAMINSGGRQSLHASTYQRIAECAMSHGGDLAAYIEDLVAEGRGFDPNKDQQQRAARGQKPQGLLARRLAFVNRNLSSRLVGPSSGIRK